MPPAGVSSTLPPISGMKACMKNTKSKRCYLCLNFINSLHDQSRLLVLTWLCCACSSLKAAGFPLHLLPQCAPSGGLAGQTRSVWHSIPAGTPVGAALGDFQCSVYSCMSAPTDAGETGSLLMTHSVFIFQILNDTLNLSCMNSSIHHFLTSL